MTGVLDILQNAGAQPSQVSSNEIRCRAVWRNGTKNNSVAIYLDNGGLIRDYPQNKSYALEDLSKLIGGEIDLSEITSVPRSIDVIETKYYYDNSILNSLIKDHSYWENRGISHKLIEKFDGGLDLSEASKTRNRYVFPIFDLNKRIVGLSGRDVTGRSKIKWKHLTGPASKQKREWLWPVHLNNKIIQEKRKIVIAESVGDVLSLMMSGVYNVICCFGLDLGNGPISYILQVDPEKIFICLNNDVNNRGNDAARKMEKRLRRYFDPEQIIIALPPEKGVDFNEMSNEDRKKFKEKYNL